MKDDERREHPTYDLDGLQRYRLIADWKSKSIDTESKSEGEPNSDQGSKNPRAVTAETLERNGEVLLVLEDTDHQGQHERRVQRAVFQEPDRLFWVTIAIACGSPGNLPGDNHAATSGVPKRYGTLKKAHNDLEAMFEYYRPMRLGYPHLVGAPPGLGKSAGYFDAAVILDNPTVERLRAEVDSLSKWIELNQWDPEYTSFQLNFFFSGHGELDADEGASLALADGTLDTEELSSILLSVIPEQEPNPANCRLDMYLDCCHSAAIAESIALSLSSMQCETDPTIHSVLELGQVYCASLDDEASFEMPGLLHSVFTFAFLNECSRKQPAGATATNIGLRDVGWYTEGKQHPLLLDFTSPEGVAFKFPSLYHLTHSPSSKIHERTFWAPDPQSDLHALNPVGGWVALARQIRDECQSMEQRLQRRRDERVPFSREEVFTNKRFPFL